MSGAWWLPQIGLSVSVVLLGVSVVASFGYDSVASAGESTIDFDINLEILKA